MGGPQHFRASSTIVRPIRGIHCPCCEPPPINNYKPLQLKLSFYKPEADQLVSVCPDSRCNSFGLASLSMSFRTFS